MTRQQETKTTQAAEKTPQADLVVRGGILWPGTGSPWGPGQVEIQGGLVSYAGPERPVRADQVLEAAGGLIMPGLVNAHCHLPMVLFRGLADDLPLGEWLNKVMMPAERTWINPETTELCALLAAAEMLLSGTTCVAESYFCTIGSARALAKAGMRGVCAQGVIDFPAPGVPDPAGKFDACREFVSACRELGPLVRPAIFAHSPYTCSPETLQQTAELAAELEVPWFIHLAETKAELATLHKRHDTTPVRHLEQLGVLASLQAGVHGIWLDDQELEIVARREVSLVHCPESNAKLTSGAPRVEKWLAAGINVALGTDGAASNNDLDLIGEMGYAARLAKLLASDPAALPSEGVLHMALEGGARALGLEGPGAPGRLAPGRAADLVVLELNAPHLTPLYSVPSHLAYAARGGDVRHVVVDGRLVVRDREVLSFDLGEVMERVQRLADRVSG